MPRWTRLDRAIFRGLGDPEAEYEMRMAVLNRPAAVKLLGRLRRSNAWREMDAVGFEYVSRQLPLVAGEAWEFKQGVGRLLGPKSGLALADRIDLPNDVALVVRFSIEDFEADPDPDAAEVDHAVLVMVWAEGSASYWGLESVLLDKLVDA